MTSQTLAAPNTSSDARHRGTLTMAERVFERIAGQAAADIAATRGRTGGLLGIGAHADSNAAPRVDVHLSGDSVDLAISAGIAYPGSIRRATQQVRAHVTERVQLLTGVPVHRVDIDVTFLAVAGTDKNREALR